MSNVKIGIIDTGLSPAAKCFERVEKSFVLKSLNEERYFLEEMDAIDNIGHGTAVAGIIYDINPHIDIILFRVSNDESEIGERGLYYVLEYIYNSVQVDIINISLGCTYLNDYNSLKEICAKLQKRGVLLVSAFDNDGAVSYPAAFDEVVGVDICADIKKRESVQLVNNSVVDVYVPNMYYRTLWNGKISIVAGTSFATARISGLLSLKYNEWTGKKDKKRVLETIADQQCLIEESLDFSKPKFFTSKAIIFPINKESKVLLQFHHLLNFELVGVYDERLNGNIGKVINGFRVNSYLEINWESDFDTVILSCTQDLSELTGKDYRAEFVQKAKEYKKRIYSFEKIIEEKNTNIFYPIMNNKMVPRKNAGKLHHTMIPIIGIMGTSSQQGKYTLQLELIERLRGRGYKTGHIATEPSGYLFGADYVYHFGYHANLNMLPQEMIAILNEMVWQTQLSGKDLIIAGCQSNTIHYIANNLDNFPIDQYAFVLGVQADSYILCVNPHDSIEYILRTRNFINSIDEGKIMALVVFPVKTFETGLGVKYTKSALSKVELEDIRSKLEVSCELPVYALDDMYQLDELADNIINYFAEELPV